MPNSFPLSQVQDGNGDIDDKEAHVTRGVRNHCRFQITAPKEPAEEDAVESAEQHGADDDAAEILHRLTMLGADRQIRGLCAQRRDLTIAGKHKVGSYLCRTVLVR